MPESSASPNIGPAFGSWVVAAQSGDRAFQGVIGCDEGSDIVVIAELSLATVRLTLLPAPVPAAVVPSRFKVTPLRRRSLCCWRSCDLMPEMLKTASCAANSACNSSRCPYVSQRRKGGTAIGLRNLDGVRCARERG